MQLDPDRLLSDIARHFRVTTAPLLAHAAWSDAQDPVGSARQWIRRKARKGDLEVIETSVHRPLGISGPLYCGAKGAQLPNCGRLAYAAKSRYGSHLQPTLTVMASADTRKRYGGGLPTRPVGSRELDHDIGVSEVFFFLLREWPDLAAEWVHEDSPEFPRERWEGKKIPDAYLRTSNVLIEFAGRYSAKKLRAIHHAFTNENYMLF